MCWHFVPIDAQSAAVRPLFIDQVSSGVRSNSSGITIANPRAALADVEEYPSSSCGRQAKKDKKMQGKKRAGLFLDRLNLVSALEENTHLGQEMFLTPFHVPAKPPASPPW